MRVAVIGAGVAGLGVAWTLARAGVEVQIYDRGRAGAGTSWAAAGMLTPWQSSPGPFDAMCRQAFVMWPGFAERLEAVSDVNLGFRRSGAMRVALNDIDAQALKAQVAQQRALGGDVQWRDPVPDYLSPDVRLAAFFADEGQVDNRALGVALARAARAAGANLHEGVAVTRILYDGAKILGVETAEGRVAANVVLLAAGAWSGGVAGLPNAAIPPVVPKKGQILSLASGAAAAPFEPLLSVQGAYAVPRSDGRVVVGATLEDTGFDARIDTASLTGLADRIRRAVMGAKDWPAVEAWSGLRPGTPDNMPVLGPGPLEGLFFATGQYRDGILLTPWIAEQVSLAIMSDGAPPSLVPFSIARFARSAMA